MLFQRNVINLKNKFNSFLLPSILTCVALSLNEFLDSIVVAQTLGAQAMAMVNMASPVMFVMSTIYTLLGVGGSTVYATLKGKLEPERAHSVYSGTMLLATGSSVLFLLVGSLGLPLLLGFFTQGLELDGNFAEYVWILILSCPLVILIQTFLNFLPAEGKPQLTTMVNIVVNVVDVVGDYVYIAYFNLGLSGAAYGTLTGYVVGALMLLWLGWRKKLPYGLPLISLKVLADWQEICSKGAASSLGQLGFFIKISFSNYMAVLLAGSVGIVAFSACFQTISVISIFLGGILGAMVPLVAMLYGQKDYQGIRLLMKSILWLELAISFAMFAFFEACPAMVLSVLGVTGQEDLATGISALRIFSFVYLFRQTVLLFMYYFQIIGAKFYAISLSIMDGFLGVMVLVFIFCYGLGLGINGLWLAYPVCSALMLLGIFITNYILQKRSQSRLQGLFLLPADQADTAVLDISLPGDSASVVKFVEELENFCLEHGGEPKKSFLAAVACEEICIYTLQQEKKNRPELDVLVRVKKDEIIMCFRSIGAVFDPLKIPKDEKCSNVELLVKLAREIKHEYLMGMNYTQVIM